MKIRYEEVTTRNVVRELPDHYGYDDSRRGRIVDILIDSKRRNDLYSDKKDVVEWAIKDIEDSYIKASKIVAIFCEVDMKD